MACIEHWAVVDDVNSPRIRSALTDDANMFHDLLLDVGSPRATTPLHLSQAEPPGLLTSFHVIHLGGVVPALVLLTPDYTQPKIERSVVCSSRDVKERGKVRAGNLRAESARWMK